MLKYKSVHRFHTIDSNPTKKGDFLIDWDKGYLKLITTICIYRV